MINYIDEKILNIIMGELKRDIENNQDKSLVITQHMSDKEKEAITDAEMIGVLAKKLYRTAYNAGFADGHTIGHEDDVAEGYDIGYSEGYDVGYDVGYSAATEAKEQN